MSGLSPKNAEINIGSLFFLISCGKFSHAKPTKPLGVPKSN